MQGLSLFYLKQSQEREKKKKRLDTRGNGIISKETGPRGVRGECVSKSARARASTYITFYTNKRPTRRNGRIIRSLRGSGIFLLLQPLHTT